MTEQYLPKSINYESVDVSLNGSVNLENATNLNFIGAFSVAVNPLNPSTADIGFSAPSGAGLNYAPAVANVAGNFPIALGTIQLYDASGLPPGSLTLLFPPAPVLNDRFEIKEIGNSFNTVVCNGNGNLVEGVFTPSSPTVTVALPRISLTYQFDTNGNIWRIV
jgi:hypothetical protein